MLHAQNQHGTTQLPMFMSSQKLLCIGYLRDREGRRAACRKLFQMLENKRNEKLFSDFNIGEECLLIVCVRLQLEGYSPCFGEK